ncbi:MAG TPA: argininosuccinate lyase [Dehalococcoidia bacterium]|nr:argininosuccinate lyase [Dehalococcoidia bacterium]
MAHKKRPDSPTAAALDPRALEYSASVSYDWRLYPYDIRGSIAHARMLGKQGIISEEDAAAIVNGLEDIEGELDAGTFELREDLEDIHLNIEVALREKIGDAGARLHTARSRNDQVATDLRMFVKDHAGMLTAGLAVLQERFCDLAEKYVNAVMPGYTHLQRAQPVLLAHHLLAYVEMFDRDAIRFALCHELADVLPLGSGALAGVPYPIDRAFVAGELAFERVSANSIDAVSDRDFVVDFHHAAALTMMHLSRFAEEIVLWSGPEFGFLRLPVGFATGSSIMPQKRNPDIAELARGRTGSVYGNLMAILTTLKGLPLSYNRDLQEDKEGLFRTADTLISTVDIFNAMIPELEFDTDRMEAAAAGGYALATDLADYLVRKGEPFRDAHQSVTSLVEHAQISGKTLSELTLDEYHRFSPLFEKDILGIDVRRSIESRDVPGGTASRRVRRALKDARKRLDGR